VTAWDDVVAVGIRGTARQPPDPSRWRGELGDDADRLSGDPPHLLLEGAALLTAARRAGGQPVRGVPAPTPAPDEPLTVVGGRLADQVDALLSGNEAVLLEHLLAGLRTRGLVLPVRHGVQLLDLARTRPWLRAAAAAVVGERGRWLAEQNPAWSWVTDLVVPQPLSAPPGPDQIDGVDAVDDRAWREGEPSARLAWLHRILREAPDRGLTLAAEALHPTRGEPAEMRAGIVALLGVQAEPLLEAALDDRAATVRAAAGTRLAHLGCGGYAERMSDRARSWVTVTPARLTVTIPNRLDAAARRDGLGGRDPDTTSPAARGGWLEEVVAAAPLHTWGPPPAVDQLVALSRQASFGAPLRRGWVRRTVIEGHREWARRLLAELPEPVDEVLAVADPADAERAVLAQLAAVTGAKSLNRWLACLLHLPHPWPGAVVEGLAAALVSVPPAGTSQLPQLMVRLATFESPSYANLFARTATLAPAQWQRSISEAGYLLDARRRLDELLDQTTGQQPAAASPQEAM
jgi:hypothetical protein